MSAAPVTQEEAALLRPFIPAAILEKAKAMQEKRAQTDRILADAYEKKKAFAAAASAAVKEKNRWEKIHACRLKQSIAIWDAADAVNEDAWQAARAALAAKAAKEVSP